MSEEQIIDLIRQNQGGQSLREYARRIGVTAAYISDIYKRRRSPGAKILQHFGIGKTRRSVVEYMVIK